MEIHEAAELLPLDEETIPELAESIRKSGLLDPIETFGGKVIDGRRRMRACAIAGVTPRFKEVSTRDPIQYVVSKHTRRNLTPGQWAMVGARATELRERLERESRERMADGGRIGGKAGSKGVEHVPHPCSGQRVRDQIGEIVGVTGRSIDYAIQVIENGVPELVKAVDQGSIGVRMASDLAKLPADVQRVEIAKPKRERQITQQPKEPAEVEAKRDAPQVEVPDDGRAIRFAHQAINALMQIRTSDPRRSRAFEMVRDWLKSNS